MKIKRFNEAYFYECENIKKSKELKTNIFNFIKSFNSNCDDNIIEWISYVSKNTKLIEYNNLTKSKKNALDFSKNKNFIKLQELLEINNNIENSVKKYETLVKNREKIFAIAANEVLYNFQKELLNKDISEFFSLFISDSFDDFVEDHITIDYIYEDIHPQIMEEFGDEIKEYIKIKTQSKKYNL